jgi:hypothetical protein
MLLKSDSANCSSIAFSSPTPSHAARKFGGVIGLM